MTCKSISEPKGKQSTKNGISRLGDLPEGLHDSIHGSTVREKTLKSKDVWL